MNQTAHNRHWAWSVKRDQRNETLCCSYQWICARGAGFLWRNHWNIIKDRWYLITWLFSSCCSNYIAIKVERLTTANINDVIVFVIVYLDDFRGQQAPPAALILRAALSVNKTVLLVSFLHKLLTLQYGSEEKCQTKMYKLHTEQMSTYLTKVRFQ